MTKMRLSGTHKLAALLAVVAVTVTGLVERVPEDVAEQNVRASADSIVAEDRSPPGYRDAGKRDRGWQAGLTGTRLQHNGQSRQRRTLNDALDGPWASHSGSPVTAPYPLCPVLRGGVWRRWVLAQQADGAANGYRWIHACGYDRGTYL